MGEDTFIQNWMNRKNLTWAWGKKQLKFDIDLNRIHLMLTMSWVGHFDMLKKIMAIDLARSRIMG